MSYRLTHRIRYVDCDMQGVVYNSHYLTFIDDTLDTWLRALDPEFEKRLGWEVMLKKATLTWDGPARLAEHLDVDASIGRWGDTSFDADFVGTVDGTPVFTATVTYVVVDADEHRPQPIPADMRQYLEG